MDELGRLDEADHAAESLGLPQSGPELLAEELRLLVGIGLGRDHPEFAVRQPQPFEELADLRQAPANARDPLDLGGGLGGRAGRVPVEVVLQGSTVLVEFARGPFPVGPLEPLDAAALELSQGAAEGLLGDPGQALAGKVSRWCQGWIT